MTQFAEYADADVNAVTSEGHNMFHIVFTQPKPDISKLVEFTRRLIEMGIDPNKADYRRMTPTHELVNLKYSDDDLAALFDLWFSQPGLDLSIRNRAGFTALDLARKLPYRTDMVSRMERYIA